MNNFSIMRLMFLFLLTQVASLAPALIAAAPVEVPLRQQWHGEIPHAELMKRSTNWFITNQDQFDKLWKAWRPKEELPAVDFAKELVFVDTWITSSHKIHPTLQENGNLRIMASDAVMIRTNSKAGGVDILLKNQSSQKRYLIATLSREGVKSINGRPLAQPSQPAAPQ